jgi:hypothetical protein
MGPNLDQSKQSERAGTWKEILDVVDSFRQLEVGDIVKPLTLDECIRPSLPTPEECLRNFTAKMCQPVPPAYAGVLQARIAHLRNRTLLSYDEILSQLSSLSVLPAQDDLDVQRKYCRSFETWFDRAAQELYAAVINQSGVSISVDSASTYSIICLTAPARE